VAPRGTEGGKKHGTVALAAIAPDIGAGRRIAIISVAIGCALAAMKIVIGWMAGSTSVVADGFESAGDVVASSIVLFGLVVASMPPDENHPYGHGRLEMVTGLIVGLILAAAGVAISVNALRRAINPKTVPAAYAIWPLVGSIATKTVLSTAKFRTGRRIGSAALVADAWNDAVDILSGAVALTAVGLTVWLPDTFLAADKYGGFAVGVIVIFTGLRVVRETSLQLMDTMPDSALTNRIRAVASEVPGVEGVEKCFARKTGLQYHVDLHLEVDPAISVFESHEIATRVRMRLRERLDFVADVLVHVEPAPSSAGPLTRRE
jgi:cation diffusion facilitator family transporter